MKVAETRQDKVFMIVNFCILSFVLIIVIYPLLYILSASLSSPQAVLAGDVWLWPIELTFDGYIAVLNYGKFWTSMINTLFYTGLGTIINILITIMAAFALSRNDLPFKRSIMFGFVFTMLFQAGIIPTFLVVRDLGLLDTRLAMILPTALSVFNLIVARTFFQQNLPQELHEAAQIDGCNDFQFFGRVALPLSLPIIAVLALFYAVGHWNQYFLALIYLRDESLFPLQMILRDILIQNEVNPLMLSDIESVVARDGLRQLLKYSVIVIASIPILIIYPFVQRHFVKGVMLGSVKE